MRLSKTRLTSAVLAALLLLLAPMGTLAAEADDAGLIGVDWTLASVAIDGTLTAVPDGVTATLALDDAQASGSTGCNGFSGPYTLDGESLAFGQLATTMALCEDPLGSIEGPYLVALALVSSWTIADDGTLQLLDAGGQPMLVFAAAPAGIEGTTWVLGEQLVDGALAAIPEGVLVTLLMEDGGAGGSGGCNSWFGSYTLEGDALSFTETRSTLMACGEPAMGVEQAFLGNLGVVASYTVTDGQLRMADAGGSEVLVFAPAPERSIVGDWVATSINDGDAIVSSTITSEVTASFGADGQLSGSDGCNTYDAPYEVDGAAITIGQLATTKMACASDELSAQSLAYAAALPTAATWSVEPDGTLTLFDVEGRVVVTYVAAAG